MSYDGKRIPYQNQNVNQISSVSRRTNEENNSISQSGNINMHKKLKSWHIILITLSAIVLIVIVTVVVIKLFKNDDSIEDICTPDTTESTNFNIRNQIRTEEEAKEAFKSNFKVTSNTNKLSQLIMKYFEQKISISNGLNSSYSYFTKSIIDVYTLNETGSDEKEKDFFSTKYTSVITLNSQCHDFTGNKNDCELTKYLDLNIKNQRNLEENYEENQEAIKKAIVPICIIEHSETNIIFSVTCPETLSKNLKDDIIKAFKIIKPESFNALTDDNNIFGRTIEHKDNKIYINIFNKDCNDYDGNPLKKPNCETIKDIITDEDGNLISINQTSTTEIIQDENNKYFKYDNYLIEDILDENFDTFNSLNYKSNLDIVFNLIAPFMKKESYISENTFQQILQKLMYDDSNTNVPIRQLEESPYNVGIIENNIYSQNVYGINITYSLKNDLGKGYGETAKAISKFNTGNNIKEITCDNSNFNLNETLNDFIVLSNAEYNLAYNLLEQLNDPLLNLRDDINENIKDLNDLLAFSGLSDIFDSTLSIDGLDKLPYKFVSSIQNLYNNLININKNIPYSVNEYKIKLKKSISSFLTESHTLLNYIYSNLTQTNDILSSKKSKIAEVSSYYLNNTDTSYVDIIQKVKEFMENYFIKEKDLILGLIDKTLQKFDNESLNSIQSILSTFDIIVEKLKKGELSIDSANTEDIIKVIDNINNCKNVVKDIIKNIIGTFNESLGILESGYFETEEYLNERNKSFTKLAEDSLKIAYELDNNLLIDKTFDNIMIYFRDQFIVLLNYMETSKRKTFPLKENILNNSFFSLGKFNEIDDDLNKEKKQILTFIKEENKEYLEFIKSTIDNFTKENQTNLDLSINNIQVYLSKLNLDNLNSTYYQFFSTTINNINTVIEDNKKLSIEYLENVKNKGSTRCTQAFKDKYNIYINKLNIIRNFIKLELKNILVNKYKNVITDIRGLLKMIKSNEVISKYHNSLPFADTHLKVIEELFFRLDKYISDTLFNQNYLPEINNFINSKINYLDSIEKEINNLYSQVNKLEYSNSDYDYYKEENNCYRCCKAHFIFCWWHGTCCDKYQQGYNIGATNNHLKLKEISIDTKDFDNLFENIYTALKNNINSYNNIVNNLLSPLENKENELLSNNEDYLISISQFIVTILNNELDSNILIQTYNYFKNELSEKLPNELNDILDQWKGVYDKVYEDLNSNLSNLKSNIAVFGYLGNFYYTIYSKNITYEYVNSLVEQRKNDMNYTIKYHYNILLSKVNKTYSYILNNIPINDKPFDEIINKRINEIKNSYNNLLSQIQNSRNQILTSTKQLSILKVNEDNYFSINSITNDNVNKIEEEIKNIKCKNLTQTAKKINENDNEELKIARFYLENYINGDQIKKLNEPIKRSSFIDLQEVAFNDLISNIYEIDQDELIKSIKKAVKESNERINTNFKYENDKYMQLIQEKIYKEFFTKEDLQNQIIFFYKNGLINLDIDSKNKIITYLDEILNNIQLHVVNETERLANELTSYSTNYNIIKQTLNNYKNEIYNKFYSAILSVVNDFYNQINYVFYINYIEKYIAQLKLEEQKEKFNEFNFLSISFNLKKIMEEIVDTLINDYKNVSKIQNEYLYDIKIKELELLFSFPTIEAKINDTITDIYNTILLPALKIYAIYNSSDHGISDYNFTLEINNNIDKFMNDKIEKIKEIVNKMKVGNFTIDDKDWHIPDFSNLKKDEFSTIKESFSNFSYTYNNQEEEDFYNVVFRNVYNNFKILIDNFVPSFGKDFFDRILKYNEIQKIKSLNYNLKYALVETLIYYYQLWYSYKIESFPEDLKIKILTLNNIESIVNSNNNKVLSTLNSRLDEFFEITKNYIVEKYISQMKIDPNIKIAFNDNDKIILYIGQILDGKRFVFENYYINSMNSYIKEPFINVYTNRLNKETKDMLSFIEQNKDEIKIGFDRLFDDKTSDILLDIENKLNDTLYSTKVYESNLNSFNIIPEEVKIFFNEYTFNEIKPKYEVVKNILDIATKNIIIDNLNQSSKIFKDAYTIQKFESKINETNYNLTNNFNIIIESLKSYGILNSQYKENLEKEMIDYRRIRSLDELDIDKINYNHKISNKKVDTIFKTLKNSSLNIKEFIETLNLFSEFYDKLGKYNHTINLQYSIAQSIIKNNTEYYDELNKKLEELYYLSNQYYIKANSSYHKNKELIINSVEQMNKLIDKCENVTFDIISSKYIEIKDNFKNISEINNKIKKIENIDNKVDNYTIKTTIENFYNKDEFMLDIIFEEGKPKVIGYINNKNIPKKIEIDIQSNYGSNGKLGSLITVELSDIMMKTNLNFDGGEKKGLINTILDYDAYRIRTKNYEKKERTKSQIIGGILFELNDFEEEIDNDNLVLGNSTDEEIKAKKIETNETFNY